MQDLTPPGEGTDRVELPLIYVVDDEAMLLELMTIILEPAGYRVETFRDAAQALSAFAAAKPRPALVVTDYSMPSMNGTALMEECRLLEPAQRFLLLSGTIEPETFAGCSCRPNGFLGKPYDAEELAAKVRSLLAD